MENHWLLPSISPLLSLTAYELEKSRENSSTGEIQPVDDFSRILHDEHSSKNCKRYNQSKNDENENENSKLSEEPLERLLADAEVKLAQLESQLCVLQRKASENEKVSEGTRKRMDQLLLRLCSTAYSIQREGLEDYEDDLRSKLSINSILSLEVTKDDIYERRNAHGEEKRKAQLGPQLRVMEEDAPSSLSGGFQKEEVDENSPDNNAESIELYQIYSDCARFLGRSAYAIEDYKAEITPVRKELVLEVIKCIRDLMNASSAQKIEASLDEHGRDQGGESDKLQAEVSSVIAAKREGYSAADSIEETGKEILAINEIAAIEGGKDHEAFEPTRTDEQDDSNPKESEEKQKDLESQPYPDSEEKNKDDEDTTGSKEYGINNENETSDISSNTERQSQVNSINSHEIIADLSGKYERNKKYGVTSSEDYPINGHGSVSKISAAVDNRELDMASKTTNLKVIPEYGTLYKYHMQSHINTATRPATVKQTQPQFRSPTATRKTLVKDTEAGLRPPLLQPRFVF